MSRYILQGVSPNRLYHILQGGWKVIGPQILVSISICLLFPVTSLPL